MSISSNQFSRAPGNRRHDHKRPRENRLHAMRSASTPDSLRRGEEREERYRRLIELCADGIFLIRQDRIAGANRAAAALFGYSDEQELRGRALTDVVRLADGGADTRLAASLDGGECPACYELRIRGGEGDAFDAEIAVTPYPDQRDAGGRLVVVRNLTERERIAGALDRQDEYLHLITDAVPAMISYIDADRRYRFVNAPYESWYGQPRAGIVGRSLRELVGGMYDEIRPYVEQALAGEAVSFDTIIMHNAQGERHVSVVYTPDIADDGTVRGFSEMVIDDTERRAAERRLRDREKQLRLITDALPVFIAQADTDYRLTFINKTYADRFGYRPQDVIGRRIPEIIGEAAFAALRQYIDAALAGKSQEHEVTVPLPHEGERQMHMMYVPEFDERGGVRGLVAAISDMTQLRRAEEQLHRREREFKTLVENSPDIISRIDRGMRHLYVNPAIISLAGIPPAAYLGKTKAELGLPAAVVAAWDDAARAAFHTGVEQKLEFDHEMKDEMRYFSGRVIPEIDRYGNIESVVGIAYDVTARARMEKERGELLARERSARIQAETAARARDEFLAIVSHELRAPLNGIQSWAHVLENYVKDATAAPLAQRALQGIKTGVAQQVRLIEDLLDVTRMMSGKLRLVKQPLSLLPVLQAAVESVRGTATARRISIDCNFRLANEQIEGDADRVQQIFWNLLSNAVKFTQEGGNVWLAASREGRELLVTIRDDGVGISPDFLPHLFNRFSQEDTSSTRDHSGLGLGLFLVRHLTDLHGGTVKADSPGEGKGSTFSVRFPMRLEFDAYEPVAALTEAGENVVLPSLKGLRVLLIDDQAEARESLAVVLANAGAAVFAASGAAEALAWLPTLTPETYPHVLVCDIAMPGEDGYAVLRKIRAWKSADGRVPFKRMPALALTAFAQREDRIRALTAGFQMHITKPAAPEELIVVLDTMAGRD
jgi:PAS domain S-box-containing protein